MSAKKPKTIGFRIAESMKNNLHVIAERESRSVSRQIEYFVKRGIQNYLNDNPEFKEETNSEKD